MARTPWTGFNCPTGCWTITPALAITATFTLSASCSQRSEDFLRRPTSNSIQLHGIEPTDYSFLGRADAPPKGEGITRKSLPRTGRATLVASSSTGKQRQVIFRLPAGWSVPRPLSQLALALPGSLHPTSTMPRHVVRAGSSGSVPYGEIWYK